MASYSEVVNDDYGRPIPGVSIYVFDRNGALASLLSGGTNPLTTDTYGRYAFDAQDGVYAIEYRFARTTKRLDSVLIGNPPEYKGETGDTGPANNTYTSYTALQASDPTRKYAYLSGDTDVPPRPDGPYSNTTGAVGEWQPQDAAGIAVALDGGRQRSVQDELGDRPVSAARFPGWGTDYAGAIRAAIATGKDVYIPYKGTLLLTSSLGTTQPNQRIFGRGKGMTVLQKAFNGDMVTLALGSSITDMTLDGDGGTYSGRGIVISTGSSAGTGFQRVDRASIVRMQGYCVEWTQNAAGWGGGMTDCDLRRYNDAFVCLKMPATETNGNRCLVNVFAGSGPLIDFDGAANVQVVACMSGSFAGAVPAWLMGAASAKIQILGGRFANAGGTTILKGQNHTVVGISHAGQFQLGDGTANSLINSKGSANDFAGFPVADMSNTSTANVNAFDLPLQVVTPPWTTTGTAPVIGDGLLAAAVSRSGGHVTFDCDLTFGSTTTAGSGGWWFKTPVKNFGRRAVGAAWMVDDSAGSIFIGAAVLDPSSDMIQVYPHQANIAQSNSPFTWAQNDKLSFTITYLAG